MPGNNHAIALLTLILLTAAPAAALAFADSTASRVFSDERVSCEVPVRLAHDCSIWSGATRPIAFGQYRMRLAAGHNGRTILVTRLKPGPDHNQHAFLPPVSLRNASVSAIRLIGSALQDQGIALERLQPIRRGRRVDAWLLEFSGNAYDFLKQFTVLESEYWLPADAD